MRLFISFTISMLLSYSLVAQNQHISEIVAPGSATIRVRPDVGIFMLTISKENPVEKVALKNYSIEIAKVTSLISKLGIPNNQVRTANLDISFDERRREFVVANSIVVQFRFDEKLIDRFYNLFYSAGIQDVSVALEKELSDSLQKVSRLQVTKMAVNAAKQRATEITSALGVKLGTVKKVETETSDLAPESSQYLPFQFTGDAARELSTSYSTYVSQEIELMERVIVTYYIEK